MAGVWACYERARRTPRTHPEKLIMMQGRRERNLAAGRCINDSDPGHHGPPFRSRRCLRCELVKLFSAATVHHLGVELLAKRVPGGEQHLRSLEQQAA